MLKASRTSTTYADIRKKVASKFTENGIYVEQDFQIAVGHRHSGSDQESETESMSLLSGEQDWRAAVAQAHKLVLIVI